MKIFVNIKKLNETIPFDYNESKVCDKFPLLICLIDFTYALHHIRVSSNEFVGYGALTRI